MFADILSYMGGFAEYVCVPESAPAPMPVIDYTRADFTRDGRSYDLILDLAADRSALAYEGSLVPGGRYLYVGGSAATLLGAADGAVAWKGRGQEAPTSSPFDQVRSAWGRWLGSAKQEDATVDDRRDRLHEVPEALRYLGEGHAKGKLVAILE